MKVLLLKDVDNLGYSGEVFDVANGYGRNYLVPRGLAVKATPGVLKEARVWREQAEARRAEQRREYEALAERIVKTRLAFTARAGESGKLYGSITTNDIIDRLNKELGTDIDNRKLTGEPLRQLGEHQVNVRLSRDVQPQLIVDIHPELDEPEMEAEEEATDEETAVVEDDLELEDESLDEFDDDIDDFDAEEEQEEPFAEAEEVAAG